ncbi:acyclic terpene utilization AtuA family protein [Salinicola halimionae]|uniref:acyclic terpene utilization AtuA family protein n=1 Tax=Salinicola halimionae TaxID=1949081 RepID=UPI00165F793B|nr:acyclic terpene utilization AtuA family protein [Salinicola halimionae]
MSSSQPIRYAHIGCGAGFAGDRPDAAVALVEALAERDGARYLFFELLAERTLAEAQLRKLEDPALGYATHLFAFLEPIVESCLAHGIPIITNGGAANPVAAAQRLRQQLKRQGLDAKIACVMGDDLGGELGEEPGDRAAIADWLPADCPLEEIVSCNVYIGAEAVTQALHDGADIVIGGRLADPSMAVGALCHAHGWAADDWQHLAVATAAGHLLECGTQITGGYFADARRKTVTDLANLGCPIAEVGSDASLVITKTPGSGGCVTEQTVKEQLLYEVHDPAAYLTPDVTLDVSRARLETLGPDRVAIHDVHGHPAPATLKGNLGLRGLWFGEAGISYAGPDAVERAQLALEILRQRLGARLPQLRPHFDLIGVASLFNDGSGEWLEKRLREAPAVEDVRLRLGIVDRDRTAIDLALQELEALYLNGPAGGGGVRRQLSESLRTRSFLIARERVMPFVSWQ